MIVEIIIELIFRPACLPSSKFIDYEDLTPSVAVGWGRGTENLKFQPQPKCDDSLKNTGCFLFGDETLSASSEALQKVDLK